MPTYLQQQHPQSGLDSGEQNLKEYRSIHSASSAGKQHEKF
jgi:hypothetical protein